MLAASRPTLNGVNLVRRILREAAVARVPECAALAGLIMLLTVLALWAVRSTNFFR